MRNIPPKKLLRWGGLTLVLVMVMIGIVFIPRWISQPDLEETYPENQIISLDNATLYYLNLTTDYHFDDLLTLDPASSRQPAVIFTPSASAFACMCVSILNPPEISLFGRNFDWYEGRKLIMETHPADVNAYSSLSMVDVDTLSLSLPEDLVTTSADLYSTLAFSPFDGMNEQGLSVGCLVSPGMIPGYNASLLTLNSLEIMRLALDYAASVADVVDLWGGYNLDYTGGPDLHYMVGDALGNSAIIEWIDGDMVVLSNVEAWQVVTNFRIYEATAADLTGCWRYNEATAVLTAAEVDWRPETVRDLLANVSVSSTQWSSVYDLASAHAYITIERQYEQASWEFWL